MCWKYTDPNSLPANTFYIEKFKRPPKKHVDTYTYTYKNKDQGLAQLKSAASILTEHNVLKR
jgi:hypothetical protein